MRNIQNRVTVLCVVLLLATRLVAADKPKNAFEAKKLAHKTGLDDARRGLITAFEKRIAQIGKQKLLGAVERLAIAGSLQAELNTFNATGCIPFSPEMRDAAMVYLVKINRTAVPLAREYHKKIELLLKENKVAEAKRLIQEKDGLVMVVGTWDCYGTNFRLGQKFTWTLYSDFTVNRTNNANGALPKGWQFLPHGGMLIKNFAPGAPPGGFDDKCSVSWDGQIFEAKNQKGGVYTGRLQ
jgi:hypothetical protein